MAYICIRKNREGKSYVYLTEGYRVGNKTKTRNLISYGKLEDLIQKEPNIIERLKDEAKKGLLGGTKPAVVSIQFDTTSKIDDSKQYYSHLLLEKIYKEMNLSSIIKQYSKEQKFNYNLDQIFKLLVFQRILNPGSKLKTFKAQNKMFGNWNIDLHDLYRSLDHFELIKEDVQLLIHDHISTTIGREAKLVMYDVTNYYFETDYDDEDLKDEDGEVIKKALRKRGPSKEKRPNPIVQLGLFVDVNNIPIAYKLFPGNQTDPITYIPAIEQVKKQFGIKKIITVADKAMNSAKNITKTNENGDGYLFSQKVRGSTGVPKDIQEFALSTKDWKFNEEQTFAFKSTIRNRKLTNGEIIEEKMIVTWSEKYARRERKRRDGAIEYAEKLTNSEKFRQAFKKGGKKYLNYEFIDNETGEITSLNPFINIDRDKLSFDARFDGLNVLITSETKESEEKLIANYKELYKIEESFRVTKTDIEARPIYVRLDNNIESHFLSCFVSLVMIRLIQKKLNNQYSAAVIQEALNSCEIFEIGQGYCKLFANENMQKINEAYNISITNQIEKKENIKKFFK